MSIGGARSRVEPLNFDINDVNVFPSSSLYSNSRASVTTKTRPFAALSCRSHTS
jgi:hypothetical protein